MKQKITIKQREILEFISRNGKTMVEVNPRLVCQNKNFYDRINRLEKIGATIIQRREGFSSLYTITNVGLEYLGLGSTGPQGAIERAKVHGNVGIISEPNSSNTKERMKFDIIVSDLDKQTKNELLKVLE